MKMRFLCLSLVLGFVWLGSAALADMRSRSAHERLIEHLDGIGGLRLQAVSYTPGVPSSMAITQVSLPVALPGSGAKAGRGTPAPVVFRLRHVIQPVASTADLPAEVRVVTTLLTDKADERVRQFAAAFDADQPFVLESGIRPGGEAVHDLSVGSVTWQTSSGPGRFEGANYRMKSKPSGDFEGTGQLSGGTLSLPDRTRLDFTNIDQQFSGKRASDGSFSTDHLFRVASMAWTGQAQDQPIRARDLTLELNARRTGEQVDGTVQLASDAIDIAWPIERLDLEMRMTNLAMQGSRGWLSLFDTWFAPLRPDASGPDDTLPRQADHGWFTFLEEFLVPGTSATLDVKLGNRNGALHALTELLFRGDGSVNGFDSINAVGDLLAAIKGTMTLSADADTFNGTPIAALLASPLASQAIDFDGTSYRSELVLADQVLTINDMPVPLQFLLADFLARPL